MEDEFFESDETRWEIRSIHPKAGEEEFVLMRDDTQMSKLMCDEIAQQECLSDVVSSAQRRFGIRLE
jgi:hypothetical protein